MRKPPKFKFVFENNHVISGNTMVEMANKYFEYKDFYDQYSYCDYIYNNKLKDYERCPSEKYEEFAILYKKREIIIKKNKAIAEDFV